MVEVRVTCWLFTNQSQLDHRSVGGTAKQVEPQNAQAVKVYMRTLSVQKSTSDEPKWCIEPLDHSAKKLPKFSSPGLFV